METKKIVKPNEEIIIRNFSNLVADCLSCIDISMSDIQTSDRFSQKRITKRSLEREIYDARNTLFALENSHLVEGIGTTLESLRQRCEEICALAFSSNGKLEDKVMGKITIYINRAKNDVVIEISNL